MSQFQFTRLTDHGAQRTHCLAEAMGTENLSQQTWLFVSPHDDDLCIGAGLFMQAAIREGATVQVLIVTDGCMGYCHLEDRDRIVDIRREEAYRSYEALGIPRDRVAYVGYPDGGLIPFIGRRRAREGEDAIAGYVGLQNALTYHLRKVRPTRVYVPTHTDLHPDHRITHSELMISVFHAAGAIWPELGEPLAEPPSVGELAVYCDFVDLPNLDELIHPQTADQKERARLLRETYKMDPEFMKEVGERYGPLEWRLPEAHAIYWAALGLSEDEMTVMRGHTLVGYGMLNKSEANIISPKNIFII